MTIIVPEVVGKCRWCGCTYNRPCDAGCGWATRYRTLCTECVELDRAMKSARGRRAIALVWQDSDRLALS